MSLADCFAEAPAKREKAEIYTGDPEFKTVEREIKVIWLYEILAALNKYDPSGWGLVHRADKQFSSRDPVPGWN
jgi:hypothetical protein